MIEYRHFFESGYGGATVAYDNEKNRYGIAVCSDKDQYSKRVGRDIATKRMEAAKPGMIQIPKLSGWSRYCVWLLDAFGWCYKHQALKYVDINVEKKR